MENEIEKNLPEAASGDRTLWAILAFSLFAAIVSLIGWQYHQGQLQKALSETQSTQQSLESVLKSLTPTNPSARFTPSASVLKSLTPTNPSARFTPSASVLKSLTPTKK